MDTTTIKRDTDIPSLLENLKKSGRYYIGPCPFCGGRDRFNVKKTRDGDLWLCRQCGDGKYKDSISFLMKLHGLSFAELFRANSAVRVQRHPRLAPEAMVIETPPDRDWQGAVSAVLARCHEALVARCMSESAAAYHYLLSMRGLTPATIAGAGLGYNSDWLEIAPDCWLAPGITIPCVVGGHLWYVQVRTTKAARRQSEARGRELDKYRMLNGSKAKALYRADTLLGAHTVVITEGEFDALLLSQFIPEGWAVVTMGGTSVLPDNPAWLRYFAAVQRAVLVMDNDKAGNKALAKWQALLPWVELLSVPDVHNDVTDFWRAGGNLRAWLMVDELMELEAELIRLPSADPKWCRIAAEYTELSPGPTFTRLTRQPVIFPGDDPYLPLPPGQWRRLDDGNIEADLSCDDLVRMKLMREAVMEGG